MESPEQEPLQERTGQRDDAAVEPDVQPLYEFPPAHLQSTNPAMHPQPAPITHVLPLEDVAPVLPPVNEDAVRNGLVYPPPPSYYQNMQPSSARPTLPPAPAQPFHPPFAQPAPPTPNSPGAVPPQRQGYARDQQPAQTQQGQQPPQGFNAQGSPGYPGYQGYPPPFIPPYERRSPVRKSRRGLWITLSIVGAVLLLACGLCSWAAYSFFAPAVQGVSGSLNTVDDYYGNLQSKDYAAAYADISTQYELSSLTQEQFVQEASARDSQYGAILSYTPGQPAYASTPGGGFDFTRFTISVDVKRANLSYTTTLYLRKIGDNWKITNFDSI
ncbi:MAG TPA: hypothetical protein VKR42_06645 [Ktedonobacteraceae bacterium]|nr:hypothetical protein [Ktedonobacteraceae bacterium]